MELDGVVIPPHFQVLDDLDNHTEGPPDGSLGSWRSLMDGSAKYHHRPLLPQVLSGAAMVRVWVVRVWAYVARHSLAPYSLCGACTGSV